MQKFWTINLSFPEAVACQRAANLGVQDDLVTAPDRERLRRLGNAQKPVELERFELINLASDLERVAGHKADRECDALSIRLMAVLGTKPDRVEADVKPVKKPVAKQIALFE